MTCSSMTKQLNGWNLTDCSGHPNVWYVLDSIPAWAEAETDDVPFSLTAGMIPPDQASPVVGMAGTGLGRLTHHAPSRRRPLGLTPGGPSTTTAAGLKQEPAALTPGLGISPGLGPAGAGAAGGPGMASQMRQAVVLDCRSRPAATAGRGTSGCDELAGHRPCAARRSCCPGEQEPR